jgi:hypothetical protein
MGGKHIEWLMVHKAPSEACDRAMVRALLHYRTKIGHSPTAAEVARDLGMNRNRTAKVLKDIELVHNDISSSTGRDQDPAQRARGAVEPRGEVRGWLHRCPLSAQAADVDRGRDPIDRRGSRTASLHG